MSTVACSVYDAIYTSVAERLGVDQKVVADTLTHREIPGDWFWAAWDETVNDAERLFCHVTGRPYDPLKEES